MALAMAVPSLPKPRLCVWADLSVHDTERLAKCGSSPAQTRVILSQIFAIEESPRGRILLDLYLHAVRFASLRRFTAEQTSAFFSIVKRTHDACVSTPFGNVDDCFAYFRELVLTHAVHRPPWSLEIFDAEQVAALSAYVLEHYFRHYKLYKYAFTPKVRLDLTLAYDGLPPTPPPELEDTEAAETAVDEATPPATEEAASELDDRGRDSNPQAAEPVVSENFDELESLVRKAVSSQLKQMHANVEQQLADTDKAISEKILNLEQGGSASPKGKGRSPKTSAKGKRK